MDTETPSIPPPRSVSPSGRDGYFPSDDSTPMLRSSNPHGEEKAVAEEKPLPETPGVPDFSLPESARQDSLQEAMKENLSPPIEIEDVAATTKTKLGGEASGADLLLPIIIYAIVKANPTRLVSHLLYTQRYRASVCATGEASYAVVNVTAAVEFLENVDLAELGLSSAEKVLR